MCLAYISYIISFHSTDVIFSHVKITVYNIMHSNNGVLYILSQYVELYHHLPMAILAFMQKVKLLVTIATAVTNSMVRGEVYVAIMDGILEHQNVNRLVSHRILARTQYLNKLHKNYQR